MMKNKGDLNAAGVGVRRQTLLFVLSVVLTTTAMSYLMCGVAWAAAGDQAKPWKEIALLYTTDVKGKIEPCG